MAGSDNAAATGPNLANGIEPEDLVLGQPLAAHIDGEAVLVTRFDGGITVIGAHCTHYGGPLAEGLVTQDSVRCPWHHACFSLRTGEALSAPALNPLPVWELEEREGRLFPARKKEVAPLSSRGRSSRGPSEVVILGAGAAGSAAAEWLRREGYEGTVTLVDPESEAPYDRPNLSKDYLAGSAPEEWIPLRPSGFFEENEIRRVSDRVIGIDRQQSRVHLESGGFLPYEALLLAPGARPRRLGVPGGNEGHVHTLRSLEDCRRIIETADGASHAAVVGAGFIGMEAAAALRSRGLEVTVVAPDRVPLERSLGVELGEMLRERHEAEGVRFRLGRQVERIEPDSVLLDDGTVLAADIVVVGIGVEPEVRLAEGAGLATSDGILVDDRLRTSDPRIFAAGDAARWPEARSGRRVRIEHWVVAQRQGQHAAANILGRDEPYRDVPFFWTVQFGTTVSYVGHARAWDRVEVESDGDARIIRYFEGDRAMAVATIGRDDVSLRAEARFAKEAADSTDGRLG